MTEKKKRWEREQLVLPPFDSGPSKSLADIASAAGRESPHSSSSITQPKDLVVRIVSSFEDGVTLGSGVLFRVRLPECVSCARTATLQSLNTLIARMKERNECPPCSQHAPSADTNLPSTTISGSSDALDASSPSTGKEIPLKGDPSTPMSAEQRLLRSMTAKKARSFLENLATLSTTKPQDQDTDEP